MRNSLTTRLASVTVDRMGQAKRDLMRRLDRAKVKAKICRQPGCKEKAKPQRTRCAKCLRKMRENRKRKG